jgi:hypothetical protein
VLAIVAEPPEVAPGEPVEVSLLLAGPGTADARVSWRACGGFFSDIGGGGRQYGDEEDGGCGGDLSVPLGEGRRVTVPGLLGQQLFSSLELASASFGAVLPEEIVQRLRTEVGIPVLVEATVELEDGGIERAVKRVIVTGADRFHGNPPAPVFEVEDVVIEADPEQRFECRRADGEPLQLEPRASVEMIPVFEGDSEPWIEPYAVITASGRVEERMERAFYSWFVTGGELAEDVTEAPLRNQVWDLPGEAGCHRLWVVMRDGHGGTSACGIDVTVGDSECADP